MANPRKRGLAQGVSKALEDMGLGQSPTTIKTILEGESNLGTDGLQALADLAQAGVSAARREGPSTAREVAGSVGALPADGTYPSTFTDDSSVPHYVMSDGSSDTGDGIVTDESRESKYIPALHATAGDTDFIIDPPAGAISSSTTGIVVTVNCDLRKQNNAAASETGYLATDAAYGITGAAGDALTEVLAINSSAGAGAGLTLAEAALTIRCGDDVAGGGQTGRAWAAGDSVVVVNGDGLRVKFSAVAADPEAGEFVGVGQNLAAATTNLIAAIDADERFDCAAGAGSSIEISDVMGKGANNEDAEPSSSSNLIVLLEDSDQVQITNTEAGEGSEVMMNAAGVAALDSSIALFANGVARAGDYGVAVAANVTGGDGAAGSLDNVASHTETFASIGLDQLPIRIRHTAGASDVANAVGNRGFVISWSQTDA